MIGNNLQRVEHRKQALEICPSYILEEYRIHGRSTRIRRVRLQKRLEESRVLVKEVPMDFVSHIFNLKKVREESEFCKVNKENRTRLTLNRTVPSGNVNLGW